jgi:hypothetical protein
VATGPYIWSDIKTFIQQRLNRPDISLDFIDTFAREVAQLSAPDIFPDGYQTDYSITLQPGQQFYPLSLGTIKVRFARFLLNQVWVPIVLLDQYEPLLYADVVQPPITSVPSIGRVFGNQLRIFPTPNFQYPLELTIEGKVEPPLLDTGANFWTGDGRVFIINKTAAKIANEYTQNDAAARRFERAAAEAHSQLMIQTHASQGPMVIQQNN